MSFTVFGQRLECKFMFVINNLTLHATVTSRGQDVAAWVDEVLKSLNDVEISQTPNPNPVNRRRLIVGISTTGMDGIVPSPKMGHSPHLGRPWFDATSSSKPPDTSNPSVLVLSPSGITDPSASSSVQLAAGSAWKDSHSEIEESVDEPSVPLSSDRTLLSKLKAPMDPSAESSSAVGGSSTANDATLHLCCGNNCLVFFHHGNCCEIPDVLVEFLFNRVQVTLVGTGVRRDGDWLGRPGMMLVYRDPWELGEARAWRGLRSLTTLEQLARKLLGKEMIAHWQTPISHTWPLTENQQLIACVHAFLLSAIGQKLVTINRESFACHFMSTLRVSFLASSSFVDSYSSRFPHDVVTYSNFVHAWCRSGNLDKDEQVLSSMRAAGIAPNVYTYTSDIDSMCRA